MKKIMPKIIFSGLIIGSIFFGATAVSAGWLTGWRYCRAIVIHNASDKELVNYFVKVENPIYEETGLLGSWHFDLAANNKTPDTSGNGKDAAVYGAVLTKGKFGKGLNLNGQSAYVDCGNIGLVKTIEFYIDDSNSADGILELSPSVNVSIASGTIVTAGFKSPKIYVNGEAKKILSGGFNHVVVATETAIEAKAVKIGVTNSYYTRGIIDEVRLYNWKLGDDDVSIHYQGKVKLNYADIRFTDSGGAVPVNYYMEKDGSFWVKIPLIAKNSNKVIYIYYGNDNADSVSKASILEEARLRKKIEPEPEVDVYAEQENL